VLCVLLLPAAEFVALPVGDRREIVLSGQAVPEVLDELKPLGSAQLKDRFEFGVHRDNIRRFREWFKAVFTMALAFEGVFHVDMRLEEKLEG